MTTPNVLQRFTLQGRVAVVTGGSRGLGLSIAHTLGQAGARLIITARKADELRAAESELRAAGIDVLATCCDVADSASAASLVQGWLQHTGTIDILINNAGATWGAAAAEYPLTAWQKVMDVNVNGAFALTQQVAVQSMLPRAQGSIIFVASILGLGANMATSAAVAYNTAKAAQINLARALAVEWGARNVRVNALLPGWFPTRMTQATLERSDAALLSSIPLQRFGDAELDLSGPILFLASDASRYMTGQCLTIDGGMTATV